MLTWHMRSELTLLSITAAAVASPLQGQSPESWSRPNILFITTDYHAGADVPWETPGLHMPALEGLASEGVVFNRHYCTAPISMPARYTLITGMYPHYHGQWDNQARWIPEGTPTMIELLRESGYMTAAVGKMHFHPWDRDAGYDIWISAERKGNSAADTVRKDDYSRHLAAAGLSRASYLNLQGSDEIYGVYDWPFADSLHIDHYVGTQATRLIEKIGESPWFLWVSFNGPHNPWDPPERYSRMYMERNMPGALWREGGLKQQPYDYTDLRYNYTRRVVDLIDEFPQNRDNYIRRIRAGHYGGLTFIDEQLGHIIESLRRSGQLENTIIVFTGDHGASLGDHDLIHKGTHFERSARVPMVVWFGNSPGQRSIDSYSSHVDILPTFLELAGVDIPGSLEGISLLPVIRGEEAGSDHAFIEIRNNYSRISDEYIFALFPSTRQEVLVDRSNDSGEYNNLAGMPEYSHITDSLRKLLYNFWPAIEKKMSEGRFLEPLPLALSLGDSAQSRQAATPYIGGKPFTLNIDCTVEEGASGILASFHQGALHAFEVRVDKGKIHAGIRRFGKNSVYQVRQSLTEGNNAIEITITSDGVMSVSVNGRRAQRFITTWPMPVQPGSEHYLNGQWFSGMEPPPRFVPVIGSVPRSLRNGILNTSMGLTISQK